MTNEKRPSTPDLFDVRLVGYLEETMRLHTAPKSFKLQTVVALIALVLIVPWSQLAIVAGMNTSEVRATEFAALPAYVSADFQHAIAPR